MNFSRGAALLVSLVISAVDIYAQTPAEMPAEAHADFVKADAELNKTYEALLKKLPDAESKEKLRQSQRAWFAFWDARYKANQVNVSRSACALILQGSEAFQSCRASS
jgi:uncharacterized protein YecT (DUF1311 family)